MDIELFDKNNIDDLVWPKNEDSKYAKDYLLSLIKNDVKEYIKNIDTEILIIKINGKILPVTKNNKEYTNSYVVSIYTHYISYTIEELHKIKNIFLEKNFKIILKLLGLILKIGEINKVLQVNNWLVSTNLYLEFSNDEIKAITEILSKYFPDYAIVFKSINKKTTPEIYSILEKNNFRMIGSRNCWFKNPEKKLEKSVIKELKRDKALEKKFFWKSIEEEYEKKIVLEYYNKLYLEKYSYFNPQFSLKYIDLMYEKKLLNFKLLYKENKLYGALGYFIRGEYMTTPILGYDIKFNKKLGIYRALSLKLFEEAKEKKLFLHESSGVGKYKKNRGAENFIEYISVKVNHLSKFRRFCWKLLEIIVNKIGMPMIIKRGL